MIVAFLALCALAYVAGPLRRGPRTVEREESGPRDALEERKEAALQALVDLEEEADLGKLDAEELAVLRERYEREALDALVALDSVGAPGEDDPLEAEVAAARMRLTCPECGAPREPGTRCIRCGA
jgi:hypothetical protein